ncbi:MAG: flagellar FliL protein [Halopseudomonas sp.]|jgi:flagellar FliL protein|uniref:flagellar basal body-associated FliL family protein n=1 Tax=Halopseudomonas sp. TaxID=2901191 RepID=UPI0039E3ED96
MAKQEPEEQPSADGEGVPVKSRKKLFVLIGAAFLAVLKPEKQLLVDGEGVPVKSRKKLFVLIGAAFLAVLVSAGGAAFFFMGGGEEPAEPVVDAAPVRQQAIYQSMDPAFVVNFTHEGRRRYLQVNVVLMGRDPEAMTALVQHLPLLRNELVLQLSSEEFSTLLTPEGKEALRERATLAVKSMLEKELGNPVIETVLFTNIVLQ